MVWQAIDRVRAGRRVEEGQEIQAGSHVIRLDDARGAREAGIGGERELRCCIEYGTRAIPHPQKAYKGGEDSSFAYAIQDGTDSNILVTLGT